MKICLISVEIFAWGKYGGFGRATRIIGRELANRGHEVYAVVPRRTGQKPVEDLDGIKVLGFPPLFPWAASGLFRECDADIFHSCEPSFGTYLAMRAMPSRKHIVTVRDPRDWQDWKTEYRMPSAGKLQVVHNYFYENNFLVRRSVRRADAVFATCSSLIPKVKTLYSLARAPMFLPTPVTVPEKAEKDPSPSVCYVGRLDRRKRPALFLELAEAFPEVKFYLMGRSRDEGWEKRLRETYANRENLNFLGFVDQFRSDLHGKILGKSWVMVNTAAREGLPNAFLEAAAHRCAILSGVDPDGFASRFGYYVTDENFVKGLAFLLEGERWRELGESGYRHVRETFELKEAVHRHLVAYEKVLSSVPPK